MARFLSQPLKVLDRIYNFVGGETQRSAFDIGAQVQPVHDVSREAERGAGTFFQISQTQTHVGADTQQNQTGLADNLPSGFDLDEDEAWLIDAFATSDTANIANCVLGFTRGTVVDLALAGRYFQTHKWDTAPYTLSAGYVPLVYSVGVAQMVRLPMWLGPQGTGGVLMNVRSTSTGALSVDVTAVMWIGPRGSTPPGLA